MAALERCSVFSLISVAGVDVNINTGVTTESEKARPVATTATSLDDWVGFSADN